MPAAIEAIKSGATKVFKIQRKFCLIRTTDDKGRNPRQDFGDLETLAKQIAEHGILDPLKGTMVGKKFMVGHGERRLAAHDLAVQKGWLKPSAKEPKTLIPVQSEGFAATTSDRDRLLHHVILNESKSLNQLEKGMAFDRLIREHGMPEEEVAETLGYTITTVRDCLKLVNGAAPALQEAVTGGKISASAAIEIVREVKDMDAQEEILEKGQAAAAARGSDRMTPKDLPIETGKAAQAARRKGKDPFEGKESTPNAPMSDHDGNFKDNVAPIQIDLPAGCGVSATVLTATIGSTIHVGWKITIPGQGKGGNGFVLVHPRVDGPTADTDRTALLLGMQQIRAEVEAREFKSKPTVLNVLDEHINPTGAAADDEKKGKGKAKPQASASALPNPVIKERDPIAELKQLIGDLNARDAEKDRYKSAKNILLFLQGKATGSDLAKYILGIADLPK